MGRQRYRYPLTYHFDKLWSSFFLTFAAWQEVCEWCISFALEVWLAALFPTGLLCLNIRLWEDQASASGIRWMHASQGRDNFGVRRGSRISVIGLVLTLRLRLLNWAVKVHYAWWHDDRFWIDSHPYQHGIHWYMLVGSLTSLAFA